MSFSLLDVGIVEDLNMGQIPTHAKSYWQITGTLPPPSLNSSVIKIKYLKQLDKIKTHLLKGFDKLITTAQRKKINELKLHKNKINMSKIPQEIFDVFKKTFLLMNQNNL